MKLRFSDHSLLILCDRLWQSSSHTANISLSHVLTKFTTSFLVCSTLCEEKLMLNNTILFLCGSRIFGIDAWKILRRGNSKRFVFLLFFQYNFHYSPFVFLCL